VPQIFCLLKKTVGVLLAVMSLSQRSLRVLAEALHFRLEALACRWPFLGRDVLNDEEHVGNQGWNVFLRHDLSLSTTHKLAGGQDVYDLLLGDLPQAGLAFGDPIKMMVLPFQARQKLGHNCYMPSRGSDVHVLLPHLVPLLLPGLLPGSQIACPRRPGSIALNLHCV
jgi:hypothetical protein